MLPRLPILLWRKLFSPQFTEAHWSRQAERGTELGLRLTMAAYRYLGDRFARCLLRPVVGWFLLTGATARRASLNYLERLNVASNGKTPAPTWANSYRHLLAFAESALDKLAAWTGNIAHTSVQFPERPAFDALLATGRGAVLLGAHLGNLEMLRALASRNQIVRINAVVFTEHAQRFAQALAAAHAGFEVNLIQVSAFGPETAIAFREKIERGEMLVIVGDRTPPAQTLEESRRITSADFLGAPALFPQGPFILAALLECPVFLFFCLREADGYCVHFEPFADRIILPRGQRQKALAELTQRYAQQLEALCRRVPYQWFNFFDFWAHPVSAAASPADPPSVNLIAPHPEP